MPALSDAARRGGVGIDVHEVVLNRLILAGLNAVSVCQDASRVDVSDD
jgi:hypothetical protein